MSSLDARKRHLMMTSFGCNDSGGCATVPLLTAKELAVRGWEVTFFHAAAGPADTGRRYELREWQEDGVQLIAVHNRPHGPFEIDQPQRELDDPPITEAFAVALDRWQPDVVHFHDLHDLGASLIDQTAVRGLTAYFTARDSWLICPRGYLVDTRGRICDGPGDGSVCASCVACDDIDGHRRRLAEIRARAHTGLTSILAVSSAVRRALLGAGYAPELVDIVHPATPRRFADYIDDLEAYYAGERPGRVQNKPHADQVAVRWKGDHGRATSLSIINDRVSSRLPGPVQRVARADGAAIDPPLPHAADVEIRHQWPPDLTAPASGALAAIVPWEFGAVPYDWLAAIERNVDELWVPSEYVRSMYLAGGVAPERVRAIPNGVDLELFTPDGPKLELEDHAGGVTRFLFVGGVIWRKGPDILLDAWKEAFAGREDVTLVIKDFGADGVYRSANRTPIREWSQSGALPRIELLHDDLPTAKLAALYRSCDVLVHPYRGEGFAMPVLEAMACGLPVIVTGGGPTDEFCPPDAGWRIASTRKYFPSDRVDTLATAGRPWTLEPDHEHLVTLLREAQADPAQRRVRGRAGQAAAARLSWDAVAALYSRRITELASRRPRRFQTDGERFPLREEVDLRLLATPAWRGHDRLSELLREWSAATTTATSACLYLLADPDVAGSPEELEAYVVNAARRAGVDLDDCADINVLMEPVRADRDERLHATVDAYVPLHSACEGHLRLATRAGSAVCELGTGDLERLVAERAQRRRAETETTP
jgi:glycosyltransferase involved in cell wall biosynthesis